MQYVRTDDGWGVVTSRELSRLQQVEIETPIGTVTVLNPIEEPQGRPDEARSDDPNDAPVHEDRSDSARWMDAALDELEADCARLDAEFNEADHPRGEDGKFGSGGGEKRSPEAIRRVMSSLERLANHPSTPKGEAEAARTRLAAMRKAHPRFTTYEPLDEPDKPTASEVQPWTEAPGGGMRNRAGYVHDPANDPRPYPNAMYSGPSSAFEKAGREKNAAWQAFQKTPTQANQAAFKAAYSNYLNLQEEDDRRRQTGAPPRKDARADAAEFNEEDHPRAEDGKFGSGGGHASFAAAREAIAANHGIEVGLLNGLKESEAVKAANVIDTVLHDMQQRHPVAAKMASKGTGRLSLTPGKAQSSGLHASFAEGSRLASSELKLPSQMRPEESDLKPGGRFVESTPSLPATLRHELAHAIEDEFVKEVAANHLDTLGRGFFHGFKTLFKAQDKVAAAKGLSKYAMEDEHEWFAESLSAYLHPDFDKSGIKLDPTLHKLFDAVFKKATEARSDDAEFVEEDHPRAPDGKFGSGGGATKSKARLEPAKTNRHGVHVTATGSPLPAHIAALKIPPAWTDVHYDTNPGAALLVAGRDAKGRAVAIYSAEHSAKAAATKYARIRELNAEFDQIVAQNEAARRDPATRDVADCLALVMATGIRPGRDADTGAAVRAYGATTLEGRHVRVSPNGHVSLQFIGKKGVSLNIPVTDPGLATMLIKRKTNAGPKGLIFETVSDRSLRKHSDAMDGGGFKTKDFRTHLGTSVASKLVASAKPPTDERSYKRAVRQIAAEVAAKLGNTPTVALQSYISPSVFSEWRMAANV